MKPEDGPARRIVAPSVSLPKGGGAIKGIGETFKTNPATGTSGLDILLPLSPARSGHTPTLTLGYDSGAGNGPFGFGFTIGLPAITRRTDRGIPRYDDAGEPDIFVLASMEDLVPVLRGDGTAWVDRRDGYFVARYRPRVENQFARIERWTSASDPSRSHWRSRADRSGGPGSRHDRRVSGAAFARRSEPRRGLTPAPAPPAPRRRVS